MTLNLQKKNNKLTGHNQGGQDAVVNIATSDNENLQVSVLKDQLGIFQIKGHSYRVYVCDGTLDLGFVLHLNNHCLEFQ